MRAAQLRQGSEVLGDPTYLRVCRGVLAFRLLACALTAAFTSPETGAAMALLAIHALLSAWGMLSDTFVRAYFRHPTLAAADTLIVVALVWLEWPTTVALLSLTLTSLLVGLALTPWLGLPGLLLTLGSVTIISISDADTRAAPLWSVSVLALPLAMIGTTALGWTIRYAFVELRRSRDLVMDEMIRRRHADERQRLARDLHDSIGKTVNGIDMAAAALMSASASGQTDTVESLAAEIRHAARTAADESRSLLRGLRRHQVDRPIAEVLGELGRERASDRLAVRVDVTGVADLPEALTHEVVAIVAEALENVTRHADASTAHVTLDQDCTELVLQISDDGRGFDTRGVRRRELQGHFGLRGIRERADHTGGDCTITSTPGQGTTVRCRWRLTDREEES